MNFAEPIRIDEHLTLADRALAAPMAGIMTPVFCLAASRMGLIRNWLTPFISITRDSVPSVAALKKKIAPFRNDHPLMVQLLGHDADSMAETALRLAECGVQGVNLNFACPAPMVVKNQNGGAVLRDPDLVFKIASAVVCKAGKYANISAKIRTGFTSWKTEMNTIADALADGGIRFIICHFRTVREMYEPVADPLMRLAQLRALLPAETVLFGNGDILSLSHAQRMASETGCDGIAAGRALLSNPFLLSKIAQNSDAAATEEEKLYFLRVLLESAVESGQCRKKWLQHSFIEYVKMCFGKETSVFRSAVADPEKFVLEILKI